MILTIGRVASGRVCDRRAYSFGILDSTGFVLGVCGAEVGVFFDRCQANNDSYLVDGVVEVFGGCFNLVVAMGRV